ncbi:MAG TPA: T9SS type A sorting domain-containing protein, partial [Bacteroidia bacterium]|nr:T9SS type A sorting domain-containing protein [Bacteroidia bacterium]
SYSQNFDNLASSGLPTGWSIDTGATATNLGTSGVKSFLTNGVAFYDTSFATGCYYCGCGSNVVSGAFKNCASGDNAGIDTSTCTEQTNATNRALGIRQSSKFGDHGASFQLELANTTNISNIAIGFKLQSLDITSGRTATWTVDYGIGATPTAFTAVTPILGAPLVTGNHVYSNDSVVVLLPAAVNNQSTPVWIRISTLSPTTGSGNRPTTAIDDFVMEYTNVNAIPTISAAAKINLKAIGAGTTNSITLGYTVANTGSYTVSLFDITGREVSTKQVELTPGGSNITLGGLTLAPGIYIAKVFNGVSSGTAKVIVK